VFDEVQEINGFTHFCPCKLSPLVKSDKEAYKEDQDKYLPIVIQRNINIPATICVFGKTFDQIGKSMFPSIKSIESQFIRLIIFNFKPEERPL
jgi:hypothetical protein